MPLSQKWKNSQTTLPFLNHLFTLFNILISKSGEDTSFLILMAANDSECCDLLYVYPWMGVVANVGGSRREVRNELEGFNPVRVVPLWKRKGHSRYAIVEFRRGLEGLNDVLRFDKAYGARGQGKRDYVGVEEKGDKLYCWVAQTHDYYSKLVRCHLQKRGELKTIEQCQKEEENRNSQLVSKLTNIRNEKAMKKAILEQKMEADEKVLRLARKQKGEKEELHRKLIGIVNTLDAKHALQLEIQSLRGKMLVIKHMKDADEEDQELETKFDDIQTQLKNKEEELELINVLNLM